MTKYKESKFLQGIFLCFSLIFAGSASATLIGDTINADLRGIDADGPATITDPGIEYTRTEFGYDNDIWTADFADDLFTLKVEVNPGRNIGGQGGIVWSFYDFDWLGEPFKKIYDVKLVSFVGNSFSDPSNISFTDDSITIEMGGLALDGKNNLFTSGTYHIITSQVSEPGTLLLLSVGLFGLCYRNYKQK